MAGKTGRTLNAQRSTPNAEVKAGEYPLVLFTSRDGAVSVQATVERESVWLSQAQMADLFGKERSVITKHIRNAVNEGEIDEKSNVHFLHIPHSDKPVAFYNQNFIVKNHSFTDGNKRIGAALFLHFLNKNKALLTVDGRKRLADHTLVALTILIAESKPAERETMLSLVMTFLADDGQGGGHG